MAVNPAHIPHLWAAFPVGYLAVPGTVTAEGRQVVRGKDNQCLWYWPVDAKFSKPGLAVFDDERPTGKLLPDLSDDSTWGAVLRLLAERCNIDGNRGVLWVPKTTTVVDRKRWSSGKAIAGWTLRTLTRHATFVLPDEKDEVVAVLKAVTMTNCACMRVLKRECPMHGEIKARPWR